MTIHVLRGVSRGIAALPLSDALAFGRFLGWLYGSVVRYHRSDALAEFKRVFPETSDRDVRKAIDRMYAHLGMNVVESLRLIAPSETYLNAYVQWEGKEHVQQALEQGRGVLLLTGHLGNWELLASLASRVFGRPFSIIAKPIKGKAFQRYLEETRGRFGMRVLPAKGSYRECFRALKRNEMIGFVLDQNMIRREGVFVDFLGRPACTTPGLAHLAVRTGAVVVPAFARRVGQDRHRAEFLPPMDPPADDSEKALTEATARYTALIEQKVREIPEQWIWLHRRWRTTPPTPVESPNTYR